MADQRVESDLSMWLPPKRLSEVGPSDPTGVWPGRPRSRLPATIAVTTNARSRTCRPRRRGAILAVTLALLTVVMLLGAALARSLVIFQRQAAACAQRQQALWLLESGVQRAQQALIRSERYEGEVWRIPAELFNESAGGRVVIRVEKEELSVDRRRVVVEASYPEAGTQRHVFVREWSIPLGEKE